MRLPPGAPRRTALEVGPDPILAGAIVEGALGGAAAGVRAAPTGRFRYCYDVTLTDGRRATVRIAPPGERKLLVETAYWSDRLQGLGLRMPEILARDLVSEFSYLVVRRENYPRLAEYLSGASRAEIGRLAGRLADLQHLVAALPPAEALGFEVARAAGRFCWSALLQQRLATYEAAIAAAGLFAAHDCDRVRLRIEAMRTAIDAIAPEPFLAGPFLESLYIGGDGEIGFTDAGPPMLGDPAFAPARLLIELAAQDRSPLIAEAWLALTGGSRNALHRLYATLCCLGLMAGYGAPVSGSRPRLNLQKRLRLEGLLHRYQPAG
jgi:hypothetical protein